MIMMFVTWLSQSNQSDFSNRAGIFHNNLLESGSENARGNV